MPFGILEDSADPFPTGTTVLSDLSHREGRRGSQGALVLSPRPSESPDDPLNWSHARKELAFLVIILGACGTGVIGPLLVPGFQIIAARFETSLTHVTLLNGSLVMALGVSSYLCAAIAKLIGKRLVFLITTLMLVAFSCWGAAAQTYNSLLAARIFQGLGMGGWFALAGTDSINDLYFVHQRGLRIGLWNFAVIVSVNITPVISGYVITDLSWRWSFWILAFYFGFIIVCVVLAFPETTFRREEQDVGQRRSSVIAVPGLGNVTVLHADTKFEPSADTMKPETDVGRIHTITPRWRRVLGLGDLKFQSLSHILPEIIEPFLLIRHPAVVWACVMWAVTFTWVIIQGAVASQIFAAPPYNMSPTAVGNLVGIAPLIGSALGTSIGGWSCDLISKFMSSRNNGIYEPEFRLLIMIPFLIFVTIGSFGLGAAVDNHLSAVSCAVFLAILNFAVGIGCTGIVAYSNDICQSKAGAAFGLAMLVKSAFAFGLTFMLNDFYAIHGPMLFFSTWGGLTVGVTLFTIPLYVYGKRVRAWSARAGVI